MLNKELRFGKDAREGIREGINILADAVGTTLGPDGNCVVIGDYHMGNPHITKDGVTVAKNIQLKDPYQNVGAQLIREAALRTVSQVGDSTTTATVLAQAFVNKAEEYLQKGCNAREIRKDVELLEKKCLDSITAVSKKIDISDVRQIATISANNDSTIGDLVGDVFEKVGKDGVVIVEESNSIATSSEIINGMQFDKGYVAPHFVTDPIKEVCILENPLILLTEKKFNTLKDISEILNTCASTRQPIVIIAEKFDDSAIETFKTNKLQGILNCCLVECPSHGEYRKEFLKDIAVAIGANVISYDSGLEIRNTLPTDLGTCKKIIITKNSTTIVEGAGSDDAVLDRVKVLQKHLDDVKSDPGLDGSFMIDFINQRIAKLIGGIARIYVGGTTELEMKERKDRVDDAVCAAKAAMEGGIVIGGGTTYANLANSLEGDSPAIEIIKAGLYAPFNKIVSNSGKDPNQFKVSENIGFNAIKGTLSDLDEDQVYDPAKAAKMAFKNAISVLNLYLSLDTVIVPEIMNNLVTL